MRIVFNYQNARFHSYTGMMGRRRIKELPPPSRGS
jgi:hypothetical protein